MTREEFRTRLENLGLNITSFSQITDRDRAHTSLLGDGKHAEIPKWVDLLLRCWEKHPGLLTQCSIDSEADFKEEVATTTGRD